MSTEYVYRCNGPECERWHESQYPVSGHFILVREPGDQGAVTELHFCSWDCVLKFAATIEPSEVIPLHGDDEKARAALRKAWSGEYLTRSEYLEAMGEPDPLVQDDVIWPTAEEEAMGDHPDAQ